MDLMDISIFSVVYKDLRLEDALDRIKKRGVNSVEVGAGGFIGKEHCNPGELLKDKEGLKKFRDAFGSRGMTINCLSCHGNPVHPQKKLAEEYHQDIKDAIDLASELGVEKIVTFSGCPGGSEGDRYPNWPVSPFPEDFQTVVEWQWKEKLIPYWKKMGKYAEDRGVKVAMELHGGYSVHTPYTMIKMRKETGCAALGGNLDPSHMWWQGIDPAKAARYLNAEECLFHFHAKDAFVDQEWVSYYGLTDMQSFGVTYGRGWQFRTVGYGHDLKTWADIFSTLRATGYDGVVSVEHEDSYMSVEEGLSKAVDNLKQVVIFEPASAVKAFDIDKKFMV
jgi:sugar phosphate isomerase/epimerase